MQFPTHLFESLSETDRQEVDRWWNTLSSERQHEISDVSQLTVEQFEQLIDLDEIDADPDTQPYYDYLINHELRVVGYVDDVTAQSSYKIMSSYVASLGSDYRHGQSGTVR